MAELTPELLSQQLSTFKEQVGDTFDKKLAEGLGDMPNKEQRIAEINEVVASAVTESEFGQSTTKWMEQAQTEMENYKKEIAELRASNLKGELPDIHGFSLSEATMMIPGGRKYSHIKEQMQDLANKGTKQMVEQSFRAIYDSLPKHLHRNPVLKGLEMQALHGKQVFGDLSESESIIQQNIESQDTNFPVEIIQMAEWWRNILLEANIMPRLPMIPMAAQQVDIPAFQQGSFDLLGRRQTTAGRGPGTDESREFPTTDVNFAEFQLQAREFGTYQFVTLTSIEDSVPALIPELTANLNLSHARGMDDVGLNGDEVITASGINGAVTISTATAEQHRKTALNGIRKYIQGRAAAVTTGNQPRPAARAKLGGTILTQPTTVAGDQSRYVLNMLATLRTGLGPAGVNYTDHFIIMSPKVWLVFLISEPFANYERAEMLATIVNGGRLDDVLGVPIVKTDQLSDSLDDDGETSATPANNVTSAIYAVTPQLWRVGMRTPPQLFSEQNTGGALNPPGWRVLLRSRWGLANHPDPYRGNAAAGLTDIRFA